MFTTRVSRRGEHICLTTGVESCLSSVSNSDPTRKYVEVFIKMRFSLFEAYVSSVLSSQSTGSWDSLFLSFSHCNLSSTGVCLHFKPLYTSAWPPSLTYVFILVSLVKVDLFHIYMMTLHEIVFHYKLCQFVAYIDCRWLRSDKLFLKYSPFIFWVCFH